MARIFYLHWNEAECAERVAGLEASGHEVRSHWSSGEHLGWGDSSPDVVVISLDRLPSHGRQVAEWVWEAQKRQVIPILFAGGKPDNIEATREKFPRAHFCPSEQVPETVSTLLAGR